MMLFCHEFHASHEGIRGYGFWYCFIEFWPKCVNIMGFMHCIHCDYAKFGVGAYIVYKLCLGLGLGPILCIQYSHH